MAGGFGKGVALFWVTPFSAFMEGRMRLFRFDGLMGNATTLHLLKTSLRNHTFRRFSIFGGVMGTGKSTSAGIVGMGLTCEDPKDGQPCLKCGTCKANMEAIEKTGQSPYLKVVNLGLANRFDDVESLIKDVFVLRGGSRNQVYILEEAHALKDVHGGFNAFLSEIDRMPLNVYVIMCTTKLSSIPADLRSRAVIYNFGRLNNKEGTALANKAARMKRANLSSSAIKIVVNSAKGIPREIEKLVTMVIEDGITEEELKNYLQVISDSAFVGLFYSFKVSDLATSVEMAGNILSDTSEPVFVDALKSFLLKAAFYVEAKINEDFDSVECAELDEIFDPVRLMKVIEVAEKLPTDSSTTDIMLALLKIRVILEGRSEKDIVGQRMGMAAKDRVLAGRAQKSCTVPEGKGKLTPLRTRSLGSFGRAGNEGTDT